MNHNKKPFDNCGGCRDYKEKCHCLCHDSINAPGYHEIIYHAGELEKSNFFRKIFNRVMRNNKI